MIYLKNHANNSVTLNLNERNPFTNPTYIFHFINKQSNEEILFSAEDISIEPKIYNRFIFSLVSDSPDYNLGVIILKSGEYSFKIYVSNDSTIPSQEELSDLLDDCSLKLIKQGISIVDYTSDVIPNIVINRERVVYERKK